MVVLVHVARVRAPVVRTDRLDHSGDGLTSRATRRVRRRDAARRGQGSREAEAKPPLDAPMGPTARPSGRWLARHCVSLAYGQERPLQATTARQSSGPPVNAHWI